MLALLSPVRWKYDGYFGHDALIHKFVESDLRLKMSRPSFFRAFQQQARLMAEDFSLGAKIVFGCMQLVAATHCVREYLVDVSICSGPSMIPTISGEGEVGERPSIL